MKKSGTVTFFKGQPVYLLALSIVVYIAFNAANAIHQGYDCRFVSRHRLSAIAYIHAVAFNLQLLRRQTNIR